MLQLYRVSVHSQEILKVISVGPHFFCTEVFTHYAQVFTKMVTDWTQEPSISKWICFERLSHIWKIFYRCTNYSWQKSECTLGRSMASSCWRIFTSWSATLHTTHPRYSLSVINSLLLPSNCTIFSSSRNAISCRVETGVGWVAFCCWSTHRWK